MKYLIYLFLFAFPILTLAAPVSQITGNSSKVPFTSQSPFGNWKDKRQQDGCEEASALMAVFWARGKTLTKENALKEILAISAYTKKYHKEYRDTSARDATEWIYKGYFKYQNVAVKKATSTDSIIAELKSGRLIIAPMDGRALKNPFFTAPGPGRHMLVIKGYDPVKKEFITNDPGTHRGESYRYPEKRLFEALRDYPTGYHKKITSIEKNFIVVWK